MSIKKHEMDMTEGPLFAKILRFSLPLIFTGLLQCLYSAADLIVVGHFRGHIALAAVGSTNALNNLIVGLNLPSKEKVYFSFMAEVTICSDFGGPQNKVCHSFHCFPIYFP